MSTTKPAPLPSLADPAFELKDFRQALVTSLGVILGFLIGFLGQWVTEESFALQTAPDYLVFFGCFGGVLLLFTALYRMLKPGVEPSASEAFYRRTLTLFLLGVGTSFSSLLVSAFI